MKTIISNTAKMSTEGVEINGVSENHVEDAIKTQKQLIGKNRGNDGNLAKENVMYDVHHYSNDTPNQLVQMVVVLNLHTNSGLSYHQTKASELEDGTLDEMRELQDKIESLNREILVERQMRGAAEEVLKHLQVVHSEADARAQESFQPNL